MHDFGMKVICDVPLPLLDIVFVHGLGGNADESWTHVTHDGTKTFWPGLLHDNFSNARISLLSYPTTRLGKLLGGNDMGFLTVAAGVTDTLCSHSAGIRPIVFIAHSLGGIVLKAALRLCHGSTDSRKQALLAETKAVVLFGTPNSGTSIGNIAAKTVGLASMQVAELARADSVLLELAQWFRGQCGNTKIRVHAFYETEAMSGAMVVDAASANPGVDGCDPVPLTANHVELCKLSSTEAQAFTSTVAFLENALSSQQASAMAPDTDTTNAAVATSSLNSVYVEELFIAADIQHTGVEKVDERSLLVDPVIYHEKTKSRITSIEALLLYLRESQAAVISGKDRSGKTLIAKLIQTGLSSSGTPTVLINGKLIGNADVLGLISRATKAQYGETPLPLASTNVIIDDFDECELSDNIKERMVADILGAHKSLFITSFSGAPSVLFAPDEYPDPDLFEISPFGDEKLLQLVQKWKQLGRDGKSRDSDSTNLSTFELLQQIFSQTEVEKYPGSAISFLQLIDTSIAKDIAFSSYAACYDTLVTAHITKIRTNWQNLDEAKNFLSYLAFTSYRENSSPTISSALFEKCLTDFRNEFFSSTKDLREIATKGFMTETDSGYEFREEYEWYFLCSRYAARTLSRGSPVLYQDFVSVCTKNIFRKQYANMIVFMSYFSQDNAILSALLDILDGLFSGAISWELSDSQKTIMLGLSGNDGLAIQSGSDVSESRNSILRQRVLDIIDDAEGVVARYTLPFLNAEIDDSEYIVAMDTQSFGADSYMKSMNALMRIHSVIGQILASRSGTFDSKTLVDCITRMVRASGRYVALNHAIAAVLVYDKQKGLVEVDRAFDNARMSREEKFDKVERIFSFWSVYISQAGLARYLSQDHAIRALRILAGKFENADDYHGRNIPFNFTSVFIIASLYSTGTLDRDMFEAAIEKYGDKSALLSILRVAVHFYSYYMPLSIQDKQWLGNKLGMPLQKLEVQRRKAVFASSGLLALPKKASEAKKRKRKRRVVVRRRS